jgi:apolipoprotein D and lipocalin family protein
MAKIIFVHNVEGAPGVTVFIGKQQVLDNFVFQQISAAIDIPKKDKKNTKITVTLADGTVILKQKVDTPCKGQTSTFIIAGLVADLSTIQGIYTENKNKCPEYGQAKIRFIHAAAGVGNVDIFSGSNKIYSNVKYTDVEKYLQVQAGVVNVAVTLANTLTVVVGPVNIFLAAGTICSLIASGSLSLDGSSLTALISTEIESDHCDKLKNDFDVKKYMGKWYQVASIPQPFAINCERQSAEYSIIDSSTVKVFNTCYQVDSAGKWIVESTITGTAVILDPEYPASLYVTFPNVPVPPVPGPGIANYLVHYTDYEYAIVGSPDRSNLYFLYRKKKMDNDLYKKLLEKAKELGYDIKKVVKDY